MIIINNNLAYRQDVRSTEKMLENIEKGMAVESAVSFLVIQKVIEALGDTVEILKTDQTAVDSTPDLILKRNGKEVRIEIQTGKAIYNGYKDIPMCFHIKEHKIALLQGECLPFICHDTGTGSPKGMYFLEPSKIQGMVKRPVPIFGNKIGYVVPIKNNLIPDNNFESIIPKIITYLQD